MLLKQMHALYCTYGAINYGVRYCHFVKGAGKIKIMHQLSFELAPGLANNDK